MECISPQYVESNDEVVIVSCGKCLACLSNKRADWIFRLNQEHKHSSGSLFVTLTYGERKVPESGLCKRDFQLFMKRLRKRVSARLRYYAVGEYGSKKGRPHYHALLFNLNLEDEIHIRKSWTVGYVHIGRVSSASVAYCTKYMVQPEVHILHPKMDKEKPFCVMSRSYGIGAHYLTDEMVAWHKEDDRLYCVCEGKKQRLPRFYRDKVFYDKEHKEKAQRKVQLSVLKKKAIFENKYSEKLRKEMRNAYLKRIKKKVAFTQMF